MFQNSKQLNMANRHLSTPPDSSGSESSFSLDNPRPYFYIVRPDKTFVPLIAIDEINPMFHIRGVPTSLTADDIEEWNMARCGDQIDRPKNYYRLEISTHGDAKPRISTNRQSGRSLTNPEGHLSTQRNDQQQYEVSIQYHDDHAPTQDIGLNPTIDGLGINGLQDSRTKVIERAEEHTSSTSIEAQHAVDQAVKENKWAKEEHPSKTKNAATPGIYGKKKFCTYWIRTGNCDYVQEGCKYLHVIPDEETRLRIGIRDMPRWAREDIPAPNHDIPAKHNPVMSQDWRRGAPRTGHVNELPEISPAQTRPAPQMNQNQNSQPRIPACAPTAVSIGSYNGPEAFSPIAATKQSTGLQNERNPLQSTSQTSQIKGTQNIQHPSQSFNSTTAAISNHANYTNQQDSAKAGLPHTLFASAAESYQRQMQLNKTFSPPIPSTPTSASNRYSPPTQPPISRPTNMAYRAPDKMESSSQSLKSASGLVQDARFSYPANHETQHSFLSSAKINQTQSTLSPITRGTLTPLPSQFSNISNQTRSGTPVTAFSNNIVNSRTTTPAMQAQSTFGGQHESIGLNEIWQRQQQPNVDDKNKGHHNVQSYRAFDGVDGRQGGSDTITNNDHGNGKHENGNHLTNVANGKTLSHNGVGGATPSSHTNSFVTPPVILHRRHFVPPGEPQYIAASVEAEQATAKKNSNAGLKKRPRGRGNDTFKLVNTDA